MEMIDPSPQRRRTPRDWGAAATIIVALGAGGLGFAWNMQSRVSDQDRAIAAMRSDVASLQRQVNDMGMRQDQFATSVGDKLDKLLVAVGKQGTDLALLRKAVHQ